MTNTTADRQDSPDSREPVSPLTAVEYVDTLTGFEEIAIKKEFSDTLTALAEAGDQSMFARALIFIDHRRQDLKVPDAFKHAMNLSRSDVKDYFTEPPKDDGPEEGDGLGESAPSS